MTDIGALVLENLFAARRDVGHANADADALAARVARLLAAVDRYEKILGLVIDDASADARANKKLIAAYSRWLDAQMDRETHPRLTQMRRLRDENKELIGK
jgi:hypothetical protein